MKKIWFKRKLYGWGWTFGTWESYAVFVAYVFFLIYIFRTVDLSSHSGSDTLIGFTIPFLLTTILLLLICWWKGEKPRWQWAKRIEDSADVLARGGIVVMPTDTTYGLLGSALNERTVNEIYRLRKRDLNKPLIILISSISDLKMFGVTLTPTQREILDRVWSKDPKNTYGPTSIVLPCKDEKFAYLHRGKNTMAFRLPAKKDLIEVLKYTGPLVAPSANPQGHSIAKNISEARAYFGHHIDFYEDGGQVVANPSRIIDITDGTEKILR